MKITCGTDIIEINRIEDCIEKLGNKFIERIFTPNEILYCEEKKGQKYQHYAARFAAKEAVFKAISGSLLDKYSIDWKEIEILKDLQGRPSVNLLNEIGNKIENIDISLSHCKEYAVANVVVIFS